LADGIAATVYIEGLVPENGDCVLDLVPDYRDRDYLRAVAQEGDGWLLPPPEDVAQLGITDPIQGDFVRRRLVPQPFRTFTQRAAIYGEPNVATARVYVIAADRTNNPFQRFACKFEKMDAWQVVKVRGGHDVILTNPVDIAQTLDRVAHGVGARRHSIAGD
jgi:hypothetical protein